MPGNNLIITLKAYIQELIGSNENSRENLLAMARYFHLIDNKEIYIYFTALFGSRGVIPQICSRIEEVYPELVAFKGYKEATIGMDTTQMPAYTHTFMEELEKHFQVSEFSGILAGNNHQIPKEAMMGEKALFEEASDLDTYLKQRHDRKVAELISHMNMNQVWFEQIISQPVIDFVAANQEVLSAVRKEDYLYVTKIPFNTKAFLEADTEAEKLYYACHCTFVREGLKELISAWQ